MAWRQVTTYVWTCDLCGRKHVADDDLQPEDWVHDMAGHDRCESCLKKPCGCDDGDCRVPVAPPP